MDIDFNCQKCSKPFKGDITVLCKLCMKKEIDDVRQKLGKRFFWSEAKRGAYCFLLYVPLTIFIGLKFGYKYELLWIGGSIHEMLIYPICNWLMRKF